MRNDVIMTTVDTSVSENRALPLCVGDIPGAAPVHHTIIQGSSLKINENTGHYHIIILISGECVFITNGVEYPYAERVSFVPAPDKSLEIKAKTNVQLLEILWDISPEDEALLAEYKTEFPAAQAYATSIQYIDRNKSQKTISRMMIPHKIIPRFAIGSVESYGYDYVKPHTHPMLDQFFFSFPENDMDVIIDGEKYPMLGNMIFHIPLGSEHGVEVTGTKHMHYMWIDFLPDNEAGLKRLESSHKPTGEMRDLEKEDKFRSHI